MAHSIFVNASNSCNSISEIAAQAHETAQAIAAMGSGEVAGSSSSVFGGTDGTQTGGLSLDLYKGNFKGTDYNYEATSVSLDDYVSQLELDISSYEKAIAATVFVGRTAPNVLRCTCFLEQHADDVYCLSENGFRVHMYISRFQNAARPALLMHRESKTVKSTRFIPRRYFYRCIVLR